MSKNTMNIETVVAVLNHSKTDIGLDDILSVTDDEDLIDFADEYEEELNDFMRLALPEIMNRLKLRMALAKSSEMEVEE